MTTIYGIRHTPSSGEHEIEIVRQEVITVKYGRGRIANTAGRSGENRSISNPIVDFGVE
jgi:hypothetical protein